MKRAASPKPKALPKPAHETAAPKRRAIMVKMEDGLRNELEVLAIARHKSVPELGLEAICDLLRKYGRPVSLRDALRKSVAERAGGSQPKTGGKRARSKTD